MKVYFVASIKGKIRYLQHYKKVIQALENIGVDIIEHTLQPSEKEVYSLTDEGKIGHYKKVLGWIGQADVIVAESSYASLGVGYEISLALEKGKPVIVLHEEGNAPHFLEGIQSDKLMIVKYDLEHLEDILERALEVSAEVMDTRFNFFISRKLTLYLDWISQKKRIPRAVYLRQLIRREMRNTRWTLAES